MLCARQAPQTRALTKRQESLSSAKLRGRLAPTGLWFALSASLLGRIGRRLHVFIR